MTIQRTTWTILTTLCAMLVSLDAGAVAGDITLIPMDGAKALDMRTITIDTGTTQQTIKNKDDDKEGVLIGRFDAGQRITWTGTDVDGRQWRGNFTVPENGGAVTSVANPMPTGTIGAVGKTSGSLNGTVTDNQGEALPGVTVTVRGAGGASQIQVTNAQGRFRFPGLGPGTYALQSELEGFSTVEYPNVKINTGRDSTVEVQLSPAIEETITVTSESPLLDERKIQTGSTVSQIELEKIPTARDPWAVLQTVPGVLTDRINVGGNESGQQSNFTGPGSKGSDSVWAVDGVVITDMTAVGAGLGYYDFDAFEEMQVTGGRPDNTLAARGVQINLVTKRGTNEFRGSGRFFFTNDGLNSAFQQETLDEKAGAGTGTDVTMGIDLGGPIVKDKLWIWANYGTGDLVNSIDVNGVVENTELENYAAKLNAQLTSNNEVFSHHYGDKIKTGRDASATRPEATTWNQAGPTGIFKLEDTHIFSSNFYLTGMASYVGGGFQITGRPALDVRTDGSLWPRGQTNYWGGEPGSGLAEEWRIDGTYFFNTGSTNHELKVGFREDEFRYNPTPGVVDGFNFFPTNNNQDRVMGTGLDRLAFADKPPDRVMTAVQFPTDLTLERLDPSFGEGHGAKLVHGLQFRMPDYAWAYPGNWQTTLAMGPRQTTISATAPTWTRGRAAMLADDALFANKTSLSADRLHDLLWKSATSTPEAGCRPVFRKGASHASHKWMLIHAELSPGHPRWFALHLGGTRPNWAELDARGRVKLFGLGLRYDAQQHMLWLTGGTTGLNRQPVYTVDLETLSLNWLSPRDPKRALHAKSNPARLCGGRAVRAPQAVKTRQAAAKVKPAALKACTALTQSVPAAIVKLALSGVNHVPARGQSCHPGSPPSTRNPERSRLSLRHPGRAYHPLYNPLTAACGCKASG